MLKLKMYCRECEHEWIEDEENENCYECPKCRSKDVYRARFIECHCGEKVYCTSFTNECDCGALYNMSGQMLASPSQWDDDDRYDCFGPQNYNEDY